MFILQIMMSECTKDIADHMKSYKNLVIIKINLLKLKLTVLNIN